jgi:hypothetical protein
MGGLKKLESHEQEIAGGRTKKLREVTRSVPKAI